MRIQFNLVSFLNQIQWTTNHSYIHCYRSKFFWNLHNAARSVPVEHHLTFHPLYHFLSRRFSFRHVALECRYIDFIGCMNFLSQELSSVGDFFYI